METSEEKFSRYHEKLRSELNRANWHFTVLKCISKIQKDYIQELNQAPAFFGLTINAHLFCAVARLNNFFDKREKKKHLHMNSFLDFIKQNLDIFSRHAFERRLRTEGRYDELAAEFNSEITPQKVEQDREKLKNLPISSLKRWRNTMLSHINMDYVAQNVDVTERYPVKTKHVEAIIDTLHEMLNEYSLAYSFSTYGKDLALEPGIQYVLDAIKFKLQS